MGMAGVDLPNYFDKGKLDCAMLFEYMARDQSSRWKQKVAAPVERSNFFSNGSDFQWAGLDRGGATGAGRKGRWKVARILMWVTSWAWEFSGGGNILCPGSGG